MLVSYNWLNEFVDLSDIKIEQIAHELTMSGLEVEEVEYIKPQFSNITTAKIMEMEQHPNADKLRLVKVDIGDKVVQVVCGAKNIEVGQTIPYARVGSKVLRRDTNEVFELTPAVIRGVKSEGMLCSADELGLKEQNYQEEDGILILSNFLNDIPLGEPLERTLGIKNDVVFNVAPTANRGDEMSIIGVARELSAIYDRKLNFSPLECVNSFTPTGFKVEIKDKDTCSYYSAAVVTGIKIKPSPDFIKQKLLNSGIRSINNVVDITNYILLEYGQPLHAFDRKKLNEYLCVRRAVDGEEIETLDGVNRKLNNDTVLIATEDKGVCIAGVFGGANSEVDDNTTEIILESAYFDSVSNRKSARSVGYRSEASARFERGVDISNVKPALLKALQLLVEYADAKIEDIVEDGSAEYEKKEITLRFSKLNKVLGAEIAPEICLNILNRLGFELLGKNETAAKFSVPSFRMNDVYREVDLIEEIARIYGYSKIPATLPQSTLAIETDEEEIVLNRINDLFLGYGLNEIMTSSLVGETLLNMIESNYVENEAVKVLNPQSDEYTTLRQNMLPSIMQVVKSNFDNGVKNIWGYELGKIYLKKNDATKNSSGVEERRVLAGVITGSLNNSEWAELDKTDFFTLKGILESLFIELDIDKRIKYQKQEGIKYLHPTKSAEIMLLGKDLTSIGFLGQIHPILANKLKINPETFVFEINLEMILKNKKKKNTKLFKPLPLYPEVQRDIAFILPEEVSNEDIHKIIKKSITPTYFKSAEVFDIYQGDNIEAGFKNMAYRIKLQDEASTLNTETIEKEITKVKDNLKKSVDNISFRE